MYWLTAIQLMQRSPQVFFQEVSTTTSPSYTVLELFELENNNYTGSNPPPVLPSRGLILDLQHPLLPPILSYHVSPPLSRPTAPKPTICVPNSLHSRDTSPERGTRIASPASTPVKQGVPPIDLKGGPSPAVVQRKSLDSSGEYSPKSKDYSDETEITTDSPLATPIGTPRAFDSPIAIKRSTITGDKRNSLALGEESVPGIEISPSPKPLKPRRNRDSKSPDKRDTTDSDDNREVPKLQRRNRTTFIVADDSPPSSGADMMLPRSLDTGSRAGSPFNKKSRPNSDTPPSPRNRPAQKFLEFSELEPKVPSVPPMIYDIESLDDLPDIPYRYVRTGMR